MDTTRPASPGWLTRLFHRPAEQAAEPLPVSGGASVALSAFEVLSGSIAERRPVPSPIPEFRLFYVRTAHGTDLAADRSSGTVLHCLPARDGCSQVVACIPVDRPDICLLTVDDAAGLTLRLEGDPDAEPVVSLRAAPLDSRACTLAHPVTGLLAAAEPPDTRSGRVVANREQPGPWERFEFVPAVDVAPAARAALVEVVSLLPAIACAQTALEAIRVSGVSGGLRPMLRLLRPSEVEWLGRKLSRDVPACKALAALYPRDAWARLALPDLAAGTIARPADDAPQPGFVREIGTSLDVLAPVAPAIHWHSFPHACSIFARRDREPTRAVCLLTTVRDEGLYLLEWIAFHRVLGVMAFFIYSNDNGDGSDELLRALAASGVVNWTASTSGPGVSPQYKAYGHALQVLPEILDYRWVGIIDLDEFVTPNRDLYASIPALLAARDTKEADALALNWVAFGSNGQTTRGAAPVTERFVTRDPGVNPHTKCFVRPHRFVHAMPHHPFADRSVTPVFRSASGRDHPASGFSPAPEDEHAFIAHFYTKSAEEYVLRRSMSRADVMLGTEVSPRMFKPDVAQAFLDQHRRGGVHDGRAAHHGPAVQEEMARLVALPGVRNALEHVEQHYRKRLHSLSRMMRDEPRFQQPDTAERWFADILHEVDRNA